MKRVLITGVTGFIGRRLAHNYAQSGCVVDGVATRTPTDLPMLDRYLQARLPDASLATFVEQAPPDICIHCASETSIQRSIDDPKRDFEASVTSTFELCEALRRHAPAARLVLLSSAAVYGNPRSLPVDELENLAPLSGYGFHKLQCELIVKEFSQIHGIRGNSARIFSAYGPRLMRQVIWDICRKLASDHPVVMHGTGAESRDFVNVEDVVSAIRLIERKGYGTGAAYNVASGEETRIDELVRGLMKQFGRNRSVSFDGQLPKGTPLNWLADLTRIKALGFKPQISLIDGLDDVVRWFKQIEPCDEINI